MKRASHTKAQPKKPVHKQHKRKLTTTKNKTKKAPQRQQGPTTIATRKMAIARGPVNIKVDNPSSFHPPVFQARPIKVNISNLFDSRAEFKRESCNLDLKLEVNHDGQNINQDVDEKTEWLDKHVMNEWYDIMIDRFCPAISKKPKQIKPSDWRQSRARKMHKQSKEKVLAASIRDSIDNTPRYQGFQQLLAENKKLFGTYNPTERQIAKSGINPDELSTHLKRTYPDRDHGV